MNIKEFAKSLNCEYKSGFWSKDIINTAKENGWVIISGASDDLMEIDGIFDDEVDCWNGGYAYISKDGVIEDCPEDNQNCRCLRIARKHSVRIEAIWSENRDDWTWSYKCPISHETFEIMDKTEKYCKGIVFSIEDIA